ncbi:DUF2599 domain-containing protein [Cellulomonas fengjieae]|uniref:DUF2599 domain-containing protein n=1 Tax=Cellulomonas fengjieae TaxID=2819978 RepID=UPI001AAE9E6C|nr:DUF2599 domain-containing protein [Cellulomonas fengjieae]MBO3101957.1 DUF2599 domain-containing protein [Cellulomonas fengjieae]
MRAGAVVATLVVLVLAGCTPGVDEPTPAPAATASPSASPSVEVTDPAALRATGLPVTSGPVTLTVAAADVSVTAQDDGSLLVDAPGALVVAPEGMTLEALSDGSAVVRDTSGAFVAGLTSQPWGSRLVQVDPEVVRLTADGEASIWFTSTAVQSAVWGEAEGGRSLAVTPSAWARAGSLAAQDGLWTQVVALAPDADVPGMRDQLECHELGAPDKDTWNLEPWRPEVGALEMISARCNP